MTRTKKSKKYWTLIGLILIGMVMMMFSCKAKGQGYFGVSGNNKGVGYHLGAMIAEKFDIHTTFTHRVNQNASIPMSWSINAGVNLNLGETELHWIFLTPYIGASFVSQENHSKANAPDYLITKEKGMYLNYGLTIEMKRMEREVSIFAGANRNKHIFGYFGIKIYPFSQ